MSSKNSQNKIIDSSTKTTISLKTGTHSYFITDYTKSNILLKFPQTTQNNFQDAISKLEFKLGQGAQLKLKILQYLLDQKFKLEIQILHLGSDSVSDISSEIFLDGKSQVDIKAQILIPEDSYNCQTSTILNTTLLSDKSKAINQPILKIYNHQVQAQHGAVVAGIDQNLKNYLETRGLSFQEQKHIYQALV